MATKASIPAATSGEIHQRLERCVATMVYYHKDGWSWSGAKLMDEEALALVAWASSIGATEGIKESFLDPLERELIKRFGAELGTRLSKEFCRAMKSRDEAD